MITSLQTKLHEEKHLATNQLLNLINKKVRIRFIKSYNTAKNHIAIGTIADVNPVYLTCFCRTFHYGKLTMIDEKHQKISGFHEGNRATRIIPWSRIEIVHILDNQIDITRPCKIRERPNHDRQPP